MEQGEFRIATATGVDAALAIAGPGVRSYAFVIDWHIRVLLAVAWYLAAALLINGSLATPVGKPAPPAFVFGALLPALAIYFLYHLILEAALRGITPGKRIAGVRIAARNGGVPSTGALLLRNLFRIVDSMPLLYVVGLATSLFTREHVRVGDLAAGTLLVWNDARPAATLERLATLSPDAQLAPAAIDVISDLLARWSELEPERRAALARALLLRLDPAPVIAPLEALSEAVLRERLERLLQAPRAAS